MHPDELAFLEEMLANAELLDCAGCGEQTLHTHEQVVSVAGGVTELVMRCTHCMECQPWFQVD